MSFIRYTGAFVVIIIVTVLKNKIIKFRPQKVDQIDFSNEKFRMKNFELFILIE